MAASQIGIGETISDEQLLGLTDEVPVGSTISEEKFATLAGAKDIQVGETINEADINSMTTTGEKSSSWLKEYSKDALSAASRAGGVAAGVLNSPLALAWGAANAKNVDPETYKKLPYWKKELYSLGKGLESAWSSISKKGDWGTLYGEYFKGTTGKTIEETLPDKLKWTAPTLEFLANVVSDPLISMGEASRIATLKMTPGAKGFTKNIPKEVIRELEKFDQLQASEKLVLQKRLVSVLESRKGYIDWWNEQIKAHPQMLKEPPTTGMPLLKPGERAIPDLTAPRAAMAGQPKEGFATLREAATEKPAALQPETALDKINEFRKSKGLPLVTQEEITKAAGVKHVPYARSTGGLVLGVEEDEDGNVVYNVKKGLAGALMVAGGVSLASTNRAKRFAQTMTQNPAWAKVHSMIGKEKKSFDFSGLLSKTNVALFDRFSKLKKASPETYTEAREFNSYKDVAKAEFNKLKEVFEPVKADEVVITDYIDAHRAMTRAQRGLKNPNGVTLQDAKTAINEIEQHYLGSGKNPQVLKDTLDGFQKWTHDNILKPSLDGGLISQKSYNSIVKNNEWYATFDVLEKLPNDINKIPSGITGEYFSLANQDIIKSMKGTEKLIADPIEATVKKFITAQSVIARNKVASTFIDSPATSSIFRPIATSAKEFKIMQNRGLNPVMQGAYDKRSFDTINRFKDGVVERYLVDKDIADSMKQLSPFQAPKVVQALNAVFRKSATTLYLPFTVSNAMRDALMAYTTAPVYKGTRLDQFVADWYKGFWEGAKHEFLGKSDLATEYIAKGGGFGYVGELRKTGAAKAELFKKGIPGKALDIAKTPFDLIEKMSAAVELAPRLGVFNRALKVGKLSNEAALMARQSTIDFNRGGVWTKILNQFVPFLNARVQGRVTYANALKNDPKSTLAKTFVSTVAPGMAAYAWNRLYYSDLYDDIPEYIKQNYFPFIYGTDKDPNGRTVPKYFVLAKGDLGQMAFNPIEFAMDAAFKRDKESVTAFAINYLSDLSPVEFSRQGEVSVSKAAGSLLPPVVKGFAEDWANLKFYQGTEVVPYYMGKNKPPELQYKETTPESYKWLGKKLGISPLRIQNFASNIFAGYGREGLSPSAMISGLTGRIVKTKGGEIENRAWTAIADIENGYVYTRAYAEELIKNGERRAAIKLITEWNKTLNNRIKEYNSEYEKAGLKDKGGIRKSYLFTNEKIQNLLEVRSGKTVSPLEERLKK